MIVIGGRQRDPNDCRSEESMIVRSELETPKDAADNATCSIK